ncbi:unnamed protein product [Ilex paraguariensis]|uniref:Uncharacterized protein n=1 Tax=Ilex paraguariensis TaxID=185542 RepID=A0ABC8U9J7_9AQUA
MLVLLYSDDEKLFDSRCRATVDIVFDPYHRMRAHGNKNGQACILSHKNSFSVSSLICRRFKTLVSSISPTTCLVVSWTPVNPSITKDD